MNKGFSFVAIFVILFALLLIIGGYLGYQDASQDAQLIQDKIDANKAINETADWKVYENAKDEYAIKYPPDWNVVLPSGSEDPFSITLRSPVVIPSYPEPIQYNLIIILGGQGENKTVKDFVDRQIIETSKQIPNFKLEERRSIAVGGEQAEWTVGFPSAQGAIYTYTLHNGELFQFIFIPYDPSIPEWRSREYAETFEKILSTFKFTSQQ